ncbi:MAG TPA: AGE family epimerase/isomerase [Planctomycetota bacterium]|nr:AGE family epimerase/isomerase [Planctomycetota bacterium]
MITAPSLDAVRAAVPYWETMLVTILRTIVDRFERRPDYPFIDTKLSILNGKDFPEAANPEWDFKSRAAVFGWIQGRGLEALAGHARWLPRCGVLTDRERTELSQRLRLMIAKVFESLEKLRAQNHGHLCFLMTPDGRAFDIAPDGGRRYIDLKDSPSTMSDLFYVKGMLAAARYLDRERKVDEARTIFRRVLADIEAGRFRKDQVGFDLKNKVAPVRGRFGHGARMIALSGCALFSAELNDTELREAGLRFIDYTLSRHIVHDASNGLQQYDMFEFTDAEGKPWIEHNRLHSDPGHATEFCGLAAKFLLTLPPEYSQHPVVTKAREVLPRVLEQNFRNGFNANVGGICKAFDLISRAPINSDMPWWSLPETIRAATLLMALCPNADCVSLLRIFKESSNGFFRSFVNPHVHLMAYQTVDATGKPADVIPATPDADPGYHTGLSIIDALDHLAKMP